jgi:hypothetical protein
MYSESDEITAVGDNGADGDDGRWTLHNKNKGIKIVRARESMRIFVEDQITT